MNYKLKWKQKYLDDKSGSWYSAKVPIISWEYIVEETCIKGAFSAGIYYTKYDDDISLITRNKKYKSVELAKAACESHLNKQAKKFMQWANK